MFSCPDASCMLGAQLRHGTGHCQGLAQVVPSLTAKRMCCSMEPRNGVAENAQSTTRGWRKCCRHFQQNRQLPSHKMVPGAGAECHQCGSSAGRGCWLPGNPSDFSTGVRRRQYLLRFSSSRRFRGGDDSPLLLKTIDNVSLCLRRYFHHVVNSETLPSSLTVMLETVTSASSVSRRYCSKLSKSQYPRKFAKTSVSLSKQRTFFDSTR